MWFVAYVFASLYSLKCFGTCSEAPVNNYSYEDSSVGTSKSFHEAEEFDLQKENFSAIPTLKNSSIEYFVKEKLLISDPLFEDISWNISGVKGPSSKRDVPHGRLTYENKMQILQLHNIYRGNVTPPAGNMAFMEWDEELARLAQVWVDECTFDHHMPENDYPETIGQNLYIGTDPTGYLGLYLWYEEHHFYDFDTQRCLPNKQCGHYKQMVWSASTKLGCAMNKCGMRYFLTCHYSPSALQGPHIYQIGKPCSQCSSKNGALCLKNLCLTWTQCKQNPFDCQFARCELECQNCGRLDKEKCKCECTDGWDSPDCSHLCIDQHVRCGKSPGWPTKAACSLMRHAVAETYCRKMCEMCNPLDSKDFNNTCCNGKLCEEGYVLDTRDKSCKCNLLCPGPVCDNIKEPEIQASLQATDDAHLTAVPLLASWVMILWLDKLLRRTDI